MPPNAQVHLPGPLQQLYVGEERNGGSGPVQHLFRTASRERGHKLSRQARVDARNRTDKLLLRDLPQCTVHLSQGPHCLGQETRKSSQKHPSAVVVAVTGWQLMADNPLDEPLLKVGGDPFLKIVRRAGSWIEQVNRLMRELEKSDHWLLQRGQAELDHDVLSVFWEPDLGHTISELDAEDGVRPVTPAVLLLRLLEHLAEP
jgi:hypothetical protein